MRALTIWQPWASLIMAGAKPYEFRRWAAYPAVVDQRIVIHAGAPKIDPAEIERLMRILDGPARHHWSTGLIAEKAIPVLSAARERPQVLPRKHGLGTALLGKSMPAKAIANVPDSSRVDQSMWAWPLTEIEHFEPPVPSPGAQGFWTWKP